MGKIEIDTGHSSAAAHRLTQASTTLDRRYVQRPSNLIVDEAARDAQSRSTNAENLPARPSRLVNLGVRAADLERVRAAETEAKAKSMMREPIILATEKNIIREDIPQNAAEADGVDETTSVNHTGKTIQPSTTAVSQDIEPVEDESLEVMSSAYSIADASSVESAQSLNADNTAVVMSNIAEEGASSEPENTTTPETVKIDTATLAASIAADYAATSLGISVKEQIGPIGMPENHTNADNNHADITSERTSTISEHTSMMTQNASIMPENSDSVEAIALAASNAIASIREATEPDQVSAQVASLKAFSENIKTKSDLPEMRELGDTIDKFVNIAMKSTKLQDEAKKNAAKSAAKVTFSPKVNRAAAKVTRSSAKIMSANAKRNRPIQSATPTMNTRMITYASRPQSPMTRQNNMKRSIKSSDNENRALEKAMLSVATMEDREAIKQPKANKKTKLPRKKTGVKRFLIAIGCAAACVAAITGIVGANIPDISVRVAAMQTGIQASYPSYVPRDYNLAGISSEDGKITMNFSGPDGASFKLIEEKSSWDSSALLRNYVEPTWKEEYATTHEQGITIYIANSSSDAAWVNGGVLYKITSSGTPLTKKQVRSIVTSL